jgi:hypothetical protein
VKLLVPVLLFFCGSQNIGAQSGRGSPDVRRFMGRVIAVTAGELVEDSVPGDGPPLPKGPASVCIEGPRTSSAIPRRHLEASLSGTTPQQEILARLRRIKIANQHAPH